MFLLTSVRFDLKIWEHEKSAPDFEFKSPVDQMEWERRCVTD